MRKGSHTWEVKNVGDGELEMWLDHSSCSCTIAKLQTKDPEGIEKPHVHVKPNATTTIELEWDTKTFPETAYHKTAVIGTNDPRHQTFTLHISGKVFPPVSVYPPEMIDFKGVSNEEPAKSSIAVYSMDMPTMKINKISTSRPEFFVAKQQPLETDARKYLHISAGGYKVDVEIKPGLPLGRFTEELVLETNHSLQKELKVSITGYATGPISIIPERVRMSSVSSREGATSNVTLLVRGGRPTKFEVVHKPEKIEVTIERNETPTQKGRYRLIINVPPGTAPGPVVEDMIIIKTDHPRASEIKIPVWIVITGSGG